MNTYWTHFSAHNVTLQWLS